MAGFGLALKSLIDIISDKRNKTIYEREQKEKKEKFGGFVDLGLSVKWSISNYEDVFDFMEAKYHCWVDMCGDQNFVLEHYYDYDKKNGTLDSYNTSPKYGNIDGQKYLLPHDDRPHVCINRWYPDKIVRTPTVREYKELVEKCQWTFCAENQIKGYRIQGPSGNSFFLPAAGVMRGTRVDHCNERGYYWTNQLGDDPMNARAFIFDQNGLQFKDIPRYWGCKHRCVME